jgi:hypothetical protein
VSSPQSRTLLTACLVAWLVVLDAGRPAVAQPPLAVPTPTFVGAILAYPGTFHSRRVIVYGTLRTETDEWWLETDDGDRIRVVGARDAVRGGRVELHAESLDIGRLTQTDPRITATGVSSLLMRVGLDRWPRPGELVVLRATRATVLRPSIQPTLKDIVLECDRFQGKTVVIVGQFRARNLYNDLPGAPGRHRHEFVLRLGAAALWVVGLRPRVNNVDLDMRTRVDTDRWFAVEGTVRREKGLVWLDGRRMAAAPVPQDVLPAPPVRPDTLGAGEVMFSLPTNDEADVPVTTTVRIQFTRPIDPRSLTGRIRVSYAAGPDGSGPTPSPPFVADYTTSDRVVTLRFRSVLERFRGVIVEVLEGVTTLGGSPITPWTLTFTTGGHGAPARTIHESVE